MAQTKTSREELELALRQIGIRRKEALERAEADLERVRQMYPRARACGLNISQIAAMAYVSRPTLHALEHQRDRRS
jgi:post-segregation antitoxin (ccd killing protein)